MHYEICILCKVLIFCNIPSPKYQFGLLFGIGQQPPVEREDTAKYMPCPTSHFIVTQENTVNAIIQSTQRSIACSLPELELIHNFVLCKKLAFSYFSRSRASAYQFLEEAIIDWAKYPRDAATADEPSNIYTVEKALQSTELSTG